MRAGTVTTIRINPRDCQSILDVLDAANVPRQHISFAQCTSLALGALLETARQNGLIPEPDEFQYLNRMQQYLGKGRSKKASIAKELNNLGGRLRAPAIEVPVQRDAKEMPFPQTDNGPKPAPAQLEVTPEELRNAQEELVNLMEMREALEGDPAWTDEMEHRYQKAYRIVYPDG